MISFIETPKPEEVINPPVPIFPNSEVEDPNAATTLNSTVQNFSPFLSPDSAVESQDVTTSVEQPHVSLLNPNSEDPKSKRGSDFEEKEPLEQLNQNFLQQQQDLIDLKKQLAVLSTQIASFPIPPNSSEKEDTKQNTDNEKKVDQNNLDNLTDNSADKNATNNSLTSLSDQPINNEESISTAKKVFFAVSSSALELYSKGKTAVAKLPEVIYLASTLPQKGVDTLSSIASYNANLGLSKFLGLTYLYKAINAEKEIERFVRIYDAKTQRHLIKKINEKVFDPECSKKNFHKFIKRASFIAIPIVPPAVYVLGKLDNSPLYLKTASSWIGNVDIDVLNSTLGLAINTSTNLLSFVINTPQLFNWSLIGFSLTKACKNLHAATDINKTRLENFTSAAKSLPYLLSATVLATDLPTTFKNVGTLLQSLGTNLPSLLNNIPLGVMTIIGSTHFLHNAKDNWLIFNAPMQATQAPANPAQAPANPVQAAQAPANPVQAAQVLNYPAPNSTNAGHLTINDDGNVPINFPDIPVFTVKAPTFEIHNSIFTPPKTSTPKLKNKITQGERNVAKIKFGINVVCAVAIPLLSLATIATSSITQISSMIASTHLGQINAGFTPWLL